MYDLTSILFGGTVAIVTVVLINAATSWVNRDYEDCLLDLLLAVYLFSAWVVFWLFGAFSSMTFGLATFGTIAYFMLYKIIRKAGAADEFYKPKGFN